MKTILKHYVIDTVSLFLVSQLFSGLVFESGILTLLLTGLALVVTSLIVKPVINLLLLPLNLLTFGLFRWISSAIALYIVTLVIEEFKIAHFHFAGFSSTWVEIPTISLGGILSYVAFSFALTFLTSFVHWLLK